MSDSILREKSKIFAKEIVFLCRQLKENRVEGVLINQLLKSGTSVGAALLSIIENKCKAAWGGSIRQME